MLSMNDVFISDFIEDVLAKIKNENINLLIDLGCGTQPYKWQYNRYNFNIITADIEQRTLDLNLLTDSRALPIIDNSVDVVIFSEVIEHVPNYEMSLSEIARILKPEGYLIITWPFIYQMHECPNDFCRLTEYGMEKVLKKHNLTIEVLRRRGNLFSTLHVMFGSLFTGLCELIRRVPYLGILIHPFIKILNKVLDLTYTGHARILRNSPSLNPKSVGANLNRISGTLALWTLGYCALVQKKK